MTNMKMKIFTILFTGLFMTDLSAATVSVKDPHLQYIGRVDFSVAGSARYDWPGVQVKFRTDADKVTFHLLDGASDYNVFVDGKHKTVLKTQPGKAQYPVTLGKGTHEVILAKRNDGNYGMADFRGLTLPKGARLLDPPARAKRKIEFIGDSITVGYGNEGAGKECPDKRPYENNWKSFASITARALKAEANFTAISGKGVVRNYGEPTRASKNPLPYYFERTIMRRGDVLWDFLSFVPDAVVIKLGTNDHSTEPAPTEAEWIGGLEKLIGNVRDKYGLGVPLFLVADDAYPVVVERMQKALQRQKKAGFEKTWYVGVDRGEDHELGCDWHPKVVVHERMARALTAAMKNALGW